MKNDQKKKGRVSPIYTVGLIFLAYSFLIHPISTVWHLLLVGLLAVVGYSAVRAIGSLLGRDREKREAEPEVYQAERTVHRVDVPRTAAQETVARQKAEQAARAAQEQPRPREPEQPKYPPEVQNVVDEGKKAHFELARLYASIPDLAVKRKVQKIIEISDLIVKDAIEDPSDVPQIKKFLDYYLPTTIKLLNAYDRMGAQGVQGSNISGTMKSIDEMLDTAIDAYQKLFDSLFADQAMDIETDIQVMNTLLKREGFINGGGSAFQVKEEQE